MGLKNILVHLDDSKSSKKRCEAALALAAAHGAHLTGLVAVTAPSMPGYIRANLPREAVEAQENYLQEVLENAGDAFEKVAKNWSVPYELRKVRASEAELGDAIALHGRHADLIVMGQEDEEDGATLSREVMEEVLLSAGRPLLVVPYIGASKTIGKRVIIAWDGGREAARALNDALPLLSDAEAVMVLIANPKSAPSEREAGSDIALHLARHNVPVEVHKIHVSEVSIGDALLDQVADLGADLVVMGGYGHSRFRELVLGGVTRQMLQQMTVPVLMSH
ncbi:universal stress protein [Limibacillus halophilus]|jgi:nucleotide-binding universal stress UspA family protein